MDCRTARNLLAFTRPHATELEKDDEEALEGHLAHCSECDAQARAERQLDAHLGRAIRTVPVPHGLHSRLLERLATERKAVHRRWLVRGAYALAAAAAVLLVTLGVWHFNAHRLPRPETGEVFAEVGWGHGSRTREDAEAWFAEQGFTAVAPPGFHYGYLNQFHVVRFRGQEVPFLEFVRAIPQTRGVQVAQVYVLSAEQFDLGALKDGESYPGQTFHVVIRKPASTPGYAYVIVYTGNLDDLLLPNAARKT